MPLLYNRWEKSLRTRREVQALRTTNHKGRKSTVARGTGKLSSCQAHSLENELRDLFEMACSKMRAAGRLWFAASLPKWPRFWLMRPQ